MITNIEDFERLTKQDIFLIRIGIDAPIDIGLNVCGEDVWQNIIPNNDNT